jgi:hypothetical protein
MHTKSNGKVLDWTAKQLAGIAWVALGWSALILGLYALYALSRFDWVGAFLAVPAVGLFVLWSRENSRKEEEAERERIALGRPRPYEPNDVYRPPTPAEQAASRAAVEAWADAHPTAHLALKWLGPLIMFGAIPLAFLIAFWPK